MEGLTLPNLTLEINPSDLIGIILVGAGAFGEVWQGIWNVEGKEMTVAIKKVPVTGVTLKMQQEITKEVEILANFSHPNILPIYGACFVAGELWIVMEYVEGGSLWDLLHSDHQIEWNTKISLAHQAAIAVDILHTSNPCIIHRDIKSPNFLVSKDHTTLKLCDFGLAKAYSFASALLSSQPREAIGTTRWGAPETFEYPPKWSNKADIYSLGMTFFEIATRKFPFEEVRDNDRVMYAVRSKYRPELPDNCPEEFSEIIRQCWDSDPRSRPSSTQVVTMLAAIPQDLNISGEFISNKSGEIVENPVSKLAFNILRDSVKLPIGGDEKEWITLHINKLLISMNECYNLVGEFCTEISCPRMTAGSNMYES